ncbi:MAG: CGCAxxGCC family protein [Ignavibacteria bacterium]|nr:MAG: CGCAxxGCC family protein [Ignavibacteria bacterium]KAF0161064.1 MAG: CGCAxxGCC family protein [Ignavibacteria bacterium]
MNPSEKTIKLYKEEYNCSQAILAAYAEELGIDEQTAIRVSSSFGGGIARTGKTCGAITGALMVLGMKEWNSEVEKEEAKQHVYELSNKLMEEFRDRNKTLYCEELLGVSVSTLEGRAVVKANNLTVKVCHRVINDATEILDKIIQKV